VSIHQYNRAQLIKPRPNCCITVCSCNLGKHKWIKCLSVSQPGAKAKHVKSIHLLSAISHPFGQTHACSPSMEHTQGARTINYTRTNNSSINQVAISFGQTHIITINGLCKGQETTTDFRMMRSPNQVIHPFGQTCILTINGACKGQGQTTDSSTPLSTQPAHTLFNTCSPSLFIDSP
jgi:hypothetical protein